MILLATATALQAQTRPDRPYAGNGAIGIHIGYPFAGLSGIYNPSARIGLQALVDFSGSRESVTGRVLYRFVRRDRTNTYAYGALGSFSGSGTDSYGFGFGAGAGVEYGWQEFSDTLPPIWGSIELGLTSWDNGGSSRTRLTVGAGIHYYF